MNTAIKYDEVHGLRVTDNDGILTDVLSSLARNNTFMPGIERVIFNEPVTKVFFKDGTCVTVKASAADTFNKELGVVYALVRRMMGKPTENGEIDSDGYMCELKRIVHNGFDQKEQRQRLNAERKAKKEAALKAAEQKINQVKNTAESVKKTVEKPSLRQCVNMLYDLLEKMDK